MSISLFLIFRIFGAVSHWADKALADGKITISETVELAESVSKILGIPLEVDVAPSNVIVDSPLDLDEEYTEARPHKTKA